MREYPLELQELSELLSNKSNTALKNYLQLKIPGFKAIMNGVTITSYELGPTMHYSFTHKIFSAAIENITITVKDASPKTINKAIRDSAPSTAGQLHINTRSMIDNFEIARLWMRLREIEQAIIDTIDKYNIIINSELKKQDIFD